MDDFNEYAPGQAYANLKDEMVSEFTIGRPLKEGTTTYKSGTTRTITNTPYGQHVKMRGPNASKAGASGPPKGFVPKPLTDDEIIDRTGVVQMRNVEDLARAYISGKSPSPMRTGDEIERDFILDSMVREKVNPYVFPQATPDNYRDMVTQSFNEHMLKPQDLGVSEHFEYTDEDTGANVHVFNYEDGRRRVFAESPLDMYDVTDNMTPPDET